MENIADFFIPRHLFYDFLELFRIRCSAIDWVLQEFQKAHVTAIFFDGVATTDSE